MAKPAIQTSQRFSRAARAEHDRLDRKRAQLSQRRDAAQARVDALDEELEAVAQQLRVLDELAGSDSGPIEIREVRFEDENGLQVLSGAAIRAVAVPVLLREHGAAPIHYKDWYTLLNKAGYAVAGKRPDAVFLNQVARSPLVRSTTKSGYYVVDADIVEQLRQQLAAQQVELAGLMGSVPEDSASLEVYRHRQRELTRAVNRSERELREALDAIEAAEGADSPEPDEIPHAKAA